MTIAFDHSWVRDLPGTFLRVVPDRAPAPRLLALNHPLAAELGLTLTEAEAARWFSGAELPPGADPIAQAYAGHQFGGFSPQLGDGRAHLLGEILAPDGRRFDLQLKGSGPTPFSRGGDGKAAVGPMLREYLISEFMAAMGVPTTRALAVVATGEQIWRETKLPGAVLARVAASHLRVGTFQFFAARGDGQTVKALADHAIARHYPDLAAADQPYLALLDAVIAAQARLVAAWMGLGFIHGVMNTDNMAISGETIDYGPCAFMEAYAPGTVFSSIDHQGRYAYANQPLILGWNLARLAETLLPLFDPSSDRAVELANDRLAGIAPRFRAEWLAVMRRKLGLPGEDAGDGELADDLMAAMEGADWTLTFRRLGDEAALRPLFHDFTRMQAWLPRWRARAGEGAAERLAGANPAVIPRNHKVEEALAAATEGDMAPFHALLAAVRQPFAGAEPYMLPAPAGLGPYVTFCGT
ncbi:protein adenylyltransferase SelO [Rhodobacter calidifons]|uniref:Protein nucleotidyltransferase YdiU n=1 Tax=Rhodobacter calidifons TaxID=2715277 RepID=A0ABX0G779_9RHOB|nr:YdiU family protein [Rhodobacter calidifons]NHB76723.1 YdiU family protein [Rhodobacter calidifons]